MATITHKMKKGRPYYYAVQCARVEGKPRIVWQKYLGTVEAIVARTESAKPPKPKEAVLFEAGGVAGLLRIAQRLGLMDLIDEAAPKRDQGPTVGRGKRFDLTPGRAFVRRPPVRSAKAPSLAAWGRQWPRTTQLLPPRGCRDIR